MVMLFGDLRGKPNVSLHLYRSVCNCVSLSLCACLLLPIHACFPADNFILLKCRAQSFMYALHEDKSTMLPDAGHRRHSKHAYLASHLPSAAGEGTRPRATRQRS